MDQGLIVLNADDGVTYLNPIAQRLFAGHSPSVAGTPLWTLAPELEKGPIRQACRLARKQHQTIAQELYFAPHRSWIDLRVVPSRDEGLLLYIRERPVQRQAETLFAESLERFELIAQTTTDLIWDWNLLADRFWRSEGADLFLSPDRRSRAMPEEDWFDCITLPDRDRVREEFHRLLASSAERGQIEYQAQRVDGEIVDLVERLLIIRDQTGKPIRIIGCVRDVSAQRRLESQLMRAQRLETVGRVAGGIAHDLNNILTPISMALDLLKLDATNEDERQVMENLHSSIAHGAGLLKQLLIFARGTESSKEPIDPRQVAVDVAQIARETFPPGIRLRESFPPNLPLMVGNLTQLRQVILNLMMNARDALGEEGTIELSLTHRPLSPKEVSDERLLAAPCIVITLSDDGPGIAPENLERIWDPFFTTKAVGQGTGLGLSTVSAIVSDHRGHITVESSGEGTTFQIYFPTHTTPALPAPAAPKPITRSLRNRRYHLLFIDNDEAIRSVAQRILEKRGYTVLTLPFCPLLFSELNPENQPIDLIIVDSFYALSDPSSLSDLRSRYSRPVPLIHTRSVQPAHFEPPPEGVAACLEKPFTATELLDCVEAQLKKAKLRGSTPLSP